MTTESSQPNGNTEKRCENDLHVEELLKRLQEETELGTVLVGVAYISEYLRRVFLDEPANDNHISDTQFELSLRDRMKAALEANLISDDDHDDLERILAIRKLFVRRLDCASFRDDEVLHECEALKWPEKLYPGEHLSARDSFVMTVSQIAVTLADKCS